jgi:hypothetical protein
VTVAGRGREGSSALHARISNLSALIPPEAEMARSRTQTMEAGLPEMQGRQGFYLLIASELDSAGMLAASLSGWSRLRR